MSFLKNLKVSKVSFVRRGANKREFLLLKSDTLGDGGTGDGNKGNKKGQEHQGGTKVRKEVKDAITLLMKTNKKSEIVNLLKSNTELKITEQETQEVTNALDLLPETENQPPPANPPTDLLKTVEELRKQNEALAVQLQESADIRKKDDIRARLKKECSHLPIAEDQAVEQLFKLEKIDKVSADLLFNSFKQTSELTKKSIILSEIGSSGVAEEAGSVVSEYLREMKKEDNVVKKADGKPDMTETVMRVVRKLGPDKWDSYRKEIAGVASRFSD